MKRDYSISFIRMLAMFMIITCHILQFYGNYLMALLNVGVQIFLVISGYLYGMKDTDVSSFFKRILKILVPYWIFLSIVCIIYYIFYPEYLSVKKVGLSFISLGVLKGIEHLWFIRYIILCYFLLPFLNIIRQRLTKDNLFVLWVLTMLAIEILGVTTKLFTGVFVNCFVFGYFLRNFDYRRNLMPSKSINAFYVLFIGLMLVSNVLKFLVKTRHVFVESSYGYNLLDTYSHLLLGAAIFLFLHQLVRIRNYGPVLLFTDKCSYHVYLVHQLFILSPLSVLTITKSVTVNVLFVYFVSILGGEYYI